MYHRLRTGQEIVPPHPKLPHAANFLYMLLGVEPAQEDAAVLDTTFDPLRRPHDERLDVHRADHRLDARPTCSRAITGAIAALKGPLHGGANEEAMKMLEEIGAPERAEAYVKERLGRKEKIMGFGHAVYKTRTLAPPC